MFYAVNSIQCYRTELAVHTVYNKQALNLSVKLSQVYAAQAEYHGYYFIKRLYFPTLQHLIPCHRKMFILSLFKILSAEMGKLLSIRFALLKSSRTEESIT